MPVALSSLLRPPWDRDRFNKAFLHTGGHRWYKPVSYGQNSAAKERLGCEVAAIKLASVMEDEKVKVTVYALIGGR
jgi:hypothetical protein